MAARRDHEADPRDPVTIDADLFADDQGVFMISVAAELAGMHPQTLRIYEARGLITPARSPKRTRLYSRSDVERLRRIHELTTEAGLNLAGVERVLALEEVMGSLREQLARLTEQTDRLQQEMLARIEQVHRSYRRDLVPWQRPGELLRREDSLASALTIPIERRPGERRPGERRPGR